MLEGKLRTIWQFRLRFDSYKKRMKVSQLCSSISKQKVSLVHGERNAKEELKRRAIKVIEPNFISFNTQMIAIS